MRLCGIRCKEYICISNVLPEDASFTNVLSPDTPITPFQIGEQNNLYPSKFPDYKFHLTATYKESMPNRFGNISILN